MTAELTTDRLSLRQWRIDDFPAYAEFYADADNTRYINGALSRIDSWNGFCAMIGQWLVRGMGVFAIEERSSCELSGYVGLWYPIDIDEPELCWGLFSNARGKGFATEAAYAVQRWTHEALNLPPLMSFVHPDNIASQNVAKRLGARELGPQELRGMPRLVFRHVIPEPQLN